MTTLKYILSRIHADARGQTYIFALFMSLFLLMVVAIGIEAGRIYSVWHRLANAVDMACVAAMKVDPYVDPVAAGRSVGEHNLEKNNIHPDISYFEINAVISGTGRPSAVQVTGTLSNILPAILRSLPGFDGFTLRAFAECSGCGDGVLSPGEECDDGNFHDGDGCSAECRNEIAACSPETTCMREIDCTAEWMGTCAGECQSGIGGNDCCCLLPGGQTCNADLDCPPDPACTMCQHCPACYMDPETGMPSDCIRSCSPLVCKNNVCQADLANRMIQPCDPTNPECTEPEECDPLTRLPCEGAGDGVCGPCEECHNTPEDCGFCGDGFCAHPLGESSDNCLWDCPDCNDRYCGRYENIYCAEDIDNGCYWSIPNPSTGITEAMNCGNGRCDTYTSGNTVFVENASNCPQDCGYCGDGICTFTHKTVIVNGTLQDVFENHDTCPEDCLCPLPAQFSACHVV